ncbi:hypothetical protein [Paraconexibacter algicola]|uniref:Asl1-like glycosyl hydrolase catalytic domain-containing protein n=1 Tax=Paraconexibacter algicola TaxID=2133960 RepID=A0A2T4UMQ5_9ACTN|nr:hypothetical protein [Paraconexibacter algicola]PTL60527.1 hypothetical protein C7Y72_13210 [Paraconexibacter algicola]
MRLRSLSVAALAALSLSALAALPSPASAKPLIGIADQKPDMFADPRFVALQLKTARYFVPFDVSTNPFQLARLDAWMAGAARDGIAPLITMERSSNARTRKKGAPSVAAYRKAVRYLRQRYPFVTAYSAWNEPNDGGQPTFRKPQLLASYTKVLQQECKGCKILAGDLLDNPNMVSYARQVEKALKKPAKIWGLHSYSDANNFRTTSTKKLLKGVKGKVWLTEVGGVVARRSAFSKATFKGKGEAHAAKATSYLFKTIAKLSPRIERMYLYHWNSASPNDSWDSAFIGPDGRERPALALLRKQLGR